MQNTQLLGDYRVCVNVSKREVSIEVDCIPTGNAVNGPYLGCNEYTYEDIVLELNEPGMRSWGVINENGDRTTVIATLYGARIQLAILRVINNELRYQEYDGVTLFNIEDIL